MTDSVTIPQLRLFGSYRRHSSPTKDFIDYQNYKLATRTNHILSSSITRLPTPIPTPIPVPVPIPVQPLPRPILEMPIIYPRQCRDFIRAPSTYVEYAEDYLIGHPLPISPRIQTGRFMGTRIAQTSRRRNSYASRCNCEQEHNHSPHRTVQENISRKAYMNTIITKPAQKKEQPNIIIKPPNKKQIHQQIDIKYTPAPNPKKQSPQNDIKKDPYLQINTERQKKQQPKKPTPGNVIINITENQSLYINESNKKKNISVVNEGSQTDNKTDPMPNKSSILVQKFMRSIPVTLDAQSFKKLMKIRLQQFYNIRIDFQDMPIIDLDDLVQTKNQYVQFSRELLVKLNQLAGDRTEMSLMYKVFKQQKKQTTIRWPNV